MRFLRYGTNLERLESKHLEMVRQWRNHKAVRLRMRYREIISAEAQTEWFNKLNAHSDWYFVAIQRDLPFGLFHIKDVNWEARCGEAGGFVGSPELIGGVQPGMAILALMDFAFFVLGLNYLEAGYYRGYEEIVLLNRQLGYEIFRDELDGFVRARVSVARYLQSTEKPRKAAARLGGQESRLIDMDDWLAEHIKKSGVAFPSEPTFGFPASVRGG
jgi:hypothetical protein